MITKIYTKVDSFFTTIFSNFKRAYTFNDQSFKEEIKELITQGQYQKAIEKCIKVIRDYPENKHLENEVIAILARLKKLQKDYRLGIITEDDYNQELKKISGSILEILDQIKLPHSNRFFLYLRLLAFPIAIYSVYLLYFFICPPTFELYGIIKKDHVGVPAVEVWSNINGEKVTVFTDKDGVFFFTIREDYSGAIAFKFKKEGRTEVGNFPDPHYWKGKKKKSELKTFYF